MRIRRRQTPAEDFQMAPMIDMVFLLLVFFMCVSSLSQAERAMPVDLPASTESKVPEDLADRATISIAADGSFYLGAERADETALAERVRRAMQANPKTRLHLRADGAVRFDVIRRVLRVCAEAGAYDVIYSTHQEG
jgi:biopolymer transport protein ExbD